MNFINGIGRVNSCESCAGETGSCSSDVVFEKTRCTVVASRCHIKFER